jgi:hypothetical protein
MDFVGSSYKPFLFASLFATLLISAQSYALISPIGLEVMADERSKFNLAFPSPKDDVVGLRLSAGSFNQNMYGLDVGLFANETKNRFAGVAVAGLLNMGYRSTFIFGLQAAGLVNASTAINGFGLQIASILNSAGSGHFVGAQVAIYRNIHMGSIYGIQLGVRNDAKSIFGVQLGIINKTDNLHGIQIGLLNFNNSGIPFLPLLNLGF